MKKNRVEAFSDGVLAIVLTIMVLELKVPHDTSPAALVQLLPIFFSYVLSFIYVGIYWNNHHHLFQMVERVSGRILWANLLFLFWITLFPFTTGWVSENHVSEIPVIFYGLNLLLCAIAYVILVHAIIRLHGKDSAIAKAIGAGGKDKLSLALYLIGILTAFISPWIALGFFSAVALIWAIPDSRIEKNIALIHQAREE